MRKILFIPLFLFWAIPAFAFNLSVTASGGSGFWAGGVYSAAVGSTITFSCTPTSGTSPYTYSWNFDDVESYKSPTSTQNPSHTFNVAGLHRVWVTVTDDDSNEEEAVLFVRLRDSITEYDAIDDCGCTDDNSTDNQAALQACVDGDGDGNMRIIFRKTDTGIYKFVAYEPDINGTDRDAMIDFAGSDKVELIGDGTGVKILWQPLADRSGFFWLDDEDDDEYFYVENLAFEYIGDDANLLDRYTYNGTERDIFRDCDFQNIRKLSRGNPDTVIRCTFDEWGKSTGNLNYGWTNSLWRWNYIHNPVAGHSHVFYNREHDYMYYYENYMDVDPPGENDKVGFHMRDGRPPIYGDRRYNEIVGNLIRNVPSWPVKFRQYDYEEPDPTSELHDSKINDNIIINCDRNDAVGITTSNSNNEISGNFFRDIDVTCINLGMGYDWPSCVDLTINNNHFGYLAGSDAGQSTISCTAGGGCSYSESGSVDDTAKYRSTDPAGWWTVDGYVDPGEYEYIPPEISAATSSGTTVQTITMLENGSGMAAGAANARFPFKVGAILQATDGSNNYSEITDYDAAPNYSFAGLSTVSEIRVADIDRNWSSLYTTSAGTSNIGIQGSFTLSGGGIY